MAFIEPKGFSWSHRPAYSLEGKIHLVKKVRRAFEQYGPPHLSTFNPNELTPDAFDIVGVGALIRRRDGNVVFITRADFPEKGRERGASEPLLFMPGGGVEEGDASLADACVREVYEETGLVAAVDALRLARIERMLLFCHFTCHELSGRPHAHGDPDAKTTSVVLLKHVDLSRIVMPADRLLLLIEKLAHGDQAAAARQFLSLAES